MRSYVTAANLFGSIEKVPLQKCKSQLIPRANVSNMALASQPNNGKARAVFARPAARFVLSDGYENNQS